MTLSKRLNDEITGHHARGDLGAPILAVMTRTLRRNLEAGRIVVAEVIAGT